MAEKEYIRLTRARARRPVDDFSGYFKWRTAMGMNTFAGVTSLWLGKDHLLRIDSIMFTEEYKRFYYRDIQAILIQHTKRRLVASLIILALLIVCILIAASMDDFSLGLFLGIFLIFPLVIMFVYNLACGPTTRCFLRTAVQTEELYSLNRLRRVRKALAKLQPLIDTAQGQLTPEEAAARMAEASATPPAPSAVPPPLTPPDGMA